jgi:crotonobetainyl-CoA:carnitine CoA-transferase CaiB-like acyl-CoA transferase
VPVRLDATPGQAPGPPPELGADGEAVLREAGYSESEVTRLRAVGAIR